MARAEYVDGQVVRPGVTIPVASTIADKFVIFQAVCVSIDPQCWRGEAKVGGRVLIATDGDADYWQAGKAAEILVGSRLVELFAGSELLTGDATV